MGALEQVVFSSIDTNGDDHHDKLVVMHPDELTFPPIRVIENPTQQAEQRFGSSIQIGEYAHQTLPTVAVASLGFNRSAGKVTIFCTDYQGLDQHLDLVTLLGPEEPGSVYGFAMDTYNTQGGGVRV